MFFWNRKKDDDKKTSVESLDSITGSKKAKKIPEINTIWDEMMVAYKDKTLQFSDEIQVDIKEYDSTIWKIEYPNGKWGQVWIEKKAVSLNTGDVNSGDGDYMTYSIELGDDEFKYIATTMRDDKMFDDFIEDVIENYLKNNPSKFNIDSAIDSFEIVYK